jgi:hypothetical protein
MYRRQAVTLFQSNLAKWGVQASVDQDVVQKATDLGTACEITAYESHLVRSFLKEGDAVITGVTKYSLLFAHLPEDKLCTLLVQAVKDALQAAPAAASTSVKAVKVEQTKKQKRR